MMEKLTTMKTPRNYLPALLLTLIWAQPLAAESQIKLTGRKDLVLSGENRQTVLEVARQHLSEKSGVFVAKAESVDTPFLFDQPVVAVQRTNDAVVTAPEPVSVNYDDASVLKAVAQNFAQQVRGTLARGSTSFLQLASGSMIKPGTSFPVSIPQAQGQTFTVTITEITANSYTLRLGEATQTVSLTGTASSSSGAIKLD